MQTVIAIDAMGGDFGTVVTVPASLYLVSKHPTIRIILVGDESAIHDTLKASGRSLDRIEVMHAPESIGMDEDPLQALRQKKHSSMRMALELVREEKAHACVSAGNTGALLAIANYVLGRLPGIKRPGLITALPTKVTDQPVYIVDLGANVDSQPAFLNDFAIMGSRMLSKRMNGRRPKVALLNNGHEATKGNQLVKDTDRLLRDAPIEYVGYIEADAMYDGEVDLIVCDGFVGNITLKAAEGTASMIKHQIKKTFNKNPLNQLFGLLFARILRGAIKNISPSRYNGASLLGLNGIVIKSHGGADAHSFGYAIEEAIQEAKEMLGGHNDPQGRAS